MAYGKVKHRFAYLFGGLVEVYPGPVAGLRGVPQVDVCLVGEIVGHLPLPYVALERPGVARFGCKPCGGAVRHQKDIRCEVALVQRGEKRVAFNSGAEAHHLPVKHEP